MNEKEHFSGGKVSVEDLSDALKDETDSEAETGTTTIDNNEGKSDIYLSYY